jgi:cellulose synthase/poly-beta-1,6-N-acetylglucosamine synthase-like glycosyltransferase
MELNILILIIIVLFYILFLLIARILLNKFSTLNEIFIRNNRRLSRILSIVNHSYEINLESIKALKDLKQNLILSSEEDTERKKKIYQIEKQEIRKLHSKNVVRRKEAAANLGIIGDSDARVGLEQALLKEKDYSVKVYLVNALTEIRQKDSLPFLIQDLLDSTKWYRTKLISNILEFGYQFNDFFIEMKDTRRLEWIELMIHYAGIVYTDETKKYLFDFVDRFDSIQEEVRLFLQNNKQLLKKYKIEYVEDDMKILLEKACRLLSDTYSSDFGKEPYTSHINRTIRLNAYWAISKNPSVENLQFLLSHISDDLFENQIITMLSKMLESNPRLIYIVEDAFEAENEKAVRSRIANVLSNQIEYYVLQLLTKKYSRAKAILGQIIQNNQVNELIGFINLNKNLDLENSLAELVKENVDPDSETGNELRIYLKKTFLSKCGFIPIEPEQSVKIEKKDPNLIKAVAVTIFISFLLIPIIFLIRHRNELGYVSWINLLTDYVIEFNKGLIYYSLVYSLFNLLLIFFSIQNVKTQARLWNYKNNSMLFRKKMIPSISIIAPAFNESKSIVSSVKSLLNLKYPDYELIVVNDGSKDETLNNLIEAFQLVRTNYRYKTSLVTAPIRGIYRNDSLPNLIVIDKSNSGKADSLNAGINVSRNEYFCCIDSDSLLESDSLLKLASLTLDESRETPALGGNILPINSCKVNNGQIYEIHAPKNVIARFQAVEYIRAFMIGRLGWQQINSMMIISGAFGLFRKDRIIGIGGYLTSKGQYQKDTVGEDMELVVRIGRMLREMKQKFVILYAYNANCWTEVPEDLKSLKNQRYRWQRGLVDILYFHRKILFNKTYGQIGFIAMPYYLIFEMVGPQFEIQGYFLVIVSILLGILNAEFALLLFISVILLGMINSIISLLIIEREESYFSIRDLIRLIWIALIENFGPRQWISLWRVLGQIKMIFRSGGWGSIQRKGI